jgi:hypothetical protein
MPTPSRTHLPVKQFIADSQILEGDGVEEDTDPALMRLPAPALRGTFAKAYALLGRLVHEIGWDELLKTRSYVFVMEEEYRNQKAQQVEEEPPTSSRTNGVIHEDGSVRDSMATTNETVVASDGDDNASTRGIIEPTDPAAPEADNDSTTHRSDESDGAENGGDGDEDEDEAPPSAQAGSTNGRVNNQGFGATTSSINKPRKAAASEADEAEEEERKRELRSGEALGMASKRLCERWLDNMFMCLYEVRLTSFGHNGQYQMYR